MATIQGSIPTFCEFRHCDSSQPRSFLSLPSFRQNVERKSKWRNQNQSTKKCVKIPRATVQQTAQGPSAIYAKEMERLSAKESLLLAFKDAGGFDALVTGKVTDIQRIDVMERITVLERLNPTPRPTTSPFLEGQWNFEWFGSGSPALSTAQFLLERFPATLASISKMDLWLKDTYAKVTVNLRLLNSVESILILSSKLSVEGPLRLKEDYDEGLLESPNVIEEAVPEQLRRALGQVVSTVQQLPVPIRDAVSNGIRVPLNGTIQRMFMISYLDEEILIIRDGFGVPEVLTRLEVVASPMADAVEYES